MNPSTNYNRWSRYAMRVFRPSSLLPVLPDELPHASYRPQRFLHPPRLGLSRIHQSHHHISRAKVSFFVRRWVSLCAFSILQGLVCHGFIKVTITSLERRWVSLCEGESLCALSPSSKAWSVMDSSKLPSRLSSKGESLRAKLNFFECFLHPPRLGLSWIHQSHYHFSRAKVRVSGVFWAHSPVYLICCNTLWLKLLYHRTVNPWHVDKLF